MKVGDLVIRKISTGTEAVSYDQRARLGYGIVLSKQMAGRPSHPCVTVFYPKISKIYDIAESLMEVANEL